MSKNYPLVLVSLFLLTSCQQLTATVPVQPVALSEAEQQQLVQQAQIKVKEFGGALLHTVQSSMQAGGAEQAIQSCQLLAPQLASQASSNGWEVARTSLKLRNPANQPDAWEQQVLEKFAQQAVQGMAVSELKYAEFVAGKFRYMQAIEIKQPCLACHGQQISPQIQAKLTQLYPNDQAIGYQLGELRGAFSLQK